MSDFEQPTEYKNALLPGYINKLDAHHKLYISLGVAVLTYPTTIGSLSTSMHVMLSWLSYSLTSIALSWTTILTSHPAEVK
ncbi:hypothetical protein [Pedobacter duraquae]|uniref:hypothetical protein n=1 Tax=Pedobacter duraquae TaxID=425511 RepID=UPI001AAC78BB|nr:hypothetical protein [Pedobacter duraquae]